MGISNLDEWTLKFLSWFSKFVIHSWLSHDFEVLSFKNAVMNDALMTLVTLFSGSSVTFEVNR